MLLIMAKFQVQFLSNQTRQTMCFPPGVLSRKHHSHQNDPPILVFQNSSTIQHSLISTNQIQVPTIQRFSFQTLPFTRITLNPTATTLPLPLYKPHLISTNTTIKHQIQNKAEETQDNQECLGEAKEARDWEREEQSVTVRY